MTLMISTEIRTAVRTAIRKVIVTSAAVMLAAVPLSMPVYAATVEYDGLRTVLEQSSPNLSSLEQNLSNVQYQIDAYESARFEMQTLAEDAKASGDAAAQAEYERTAEQFTSQLSRLKKSYRKSTEGDRSSLETTLNRLEKSAQSMFISYNRAVLNTATAQKNYDAAAASCNTTLNRYNVGMAGETDVAKASNDMLMRQNLLTSAQEQESTARRNLFNTLGLTDDGTVTIGTPPLPDTEAIAAIEPEADVARYVGYDSDVQSARHMKSSSPIKEGTEVKADGEARAEFYDNYNQLQADLQSYTAALSSYQSAQQQFASKQRRKEAGLLTETDFKSAEAAYQAALGTYQTAAWDLLSAYEAYKWALKGV